MIFPMKLSYYCGIVLVGGKHDRRVVVHATVVFLREMKKPADGTSLVLPCDWGALS